jgi:conserved oligomeric Golgi complex subunit 5
MLKRDVGKKAKHQLITGLQTRKMSQITSAVKVLHNLTTLVTITKEIVKNTSDTVQQIIKDNLDVHTLTQSSNSSNTKKGPGRAAVPTPGNVSSFRPRMWSALEKIFENIYTFSIQIQTLEISLKQNCDDYIVTKSQTFLDIFPDNMKNLTRDFWNSTTSFLAEQLVKSANESMFVKQALEGEYPKFLRLYMDVCKRLQTAEKPDNFEFEFNVNKDVIGPFEKSYLSKSVSMVLDPVHNMFSKEGVPEAEEVDLLIRTIRR